MIKYLTINILFCSLFLIGCNKSKKSQLRIAVIPKGTTHEFWKMGEAGARKAGMSLESRLFGKDLKKRVTEQGKLR